MTDDVRIFSGTPGQSSGSFDRYCFRFATLDEIEADLLALGATLVEARHVADTVPRYLVPKPEAARSAAIEALAAGGLGMRSSTVPARVCQSQSRWPLRRTSRAGDFSP